MPKIDKNYKRFGIKEINEEELRKEIGDVAGVLEETEENVLDKIFEEWVLVGARKTPKVGKTVSGGDVKSGYVGYKTKSTETGNDEKPSLAMLLFQVAEAVNESPEDTESFLHALYKTACQLHKLQDGDDDEEEYKGSGMSLEEAKTHVLKSFLDVAVDSFKTFEGKKHYIVTCLASYLAARLLVEGDADVKRNVKRQMRRAQRGDVDDNPIWEHSQAILKIVDDTLDMMDDGKSTEDILEAFKEYVADRETKRHRQ